MLFDGSKRYQPGVLRRILDPDELQQAVHWDGAGRIYKDAEENDAVQLLYSFETPRTWEPPARTRRWVEAAADLGWGWVVAVLWFVVWVGGVVEAADSTWRDISLVMTMGTVVVVGTLIAYMFHQKRMDDARAQERAAAAARWLREHPRKGKGWREV